MRYKMGSIIGEIIRDAAHGDKNFNPVRGLQVLFGYEGGQTRVVPRDKLVAVEELPAPKPLMGHPPKQVQQSVPAQQYTGFGPGVVEVKNVAYPAKPTDLPPQPPPTKAAPKAEPKKPPAKKPLARRSY